MFDIVQDGVIIESQVGIINVLFDQVTLLVM